jgi:simple sugar transport system permease protein
MILGVTFSEDAIIGLIIAAIQFGTLLYLAALGETIAEKSGVINLGVEGMMAIGAVTGYIGGATSGSVVSGLALTILGLGLADFIGTDYTGDPRRSHFKNIDIPGLSDIPWVGETIFSATPVTYLAAALGVAAWWVLSRSSLGLGIRAAGESASTADAAGHSVAGMRVGAIAVGGGLAGMSGAYLTNTLLGTSWNVGVTAGRGWIAVALVIFGAWRPGRVAIGAAVFGLTLALQTRLSFFDINVSGTLVSMTPYLMTVIVLVIISYRARSQPSPAPAGLGLAYRREER